MTGSSYLRRPTAVLAALLLFGALVASAHASDRSHGQVPQQPRSEICEDDCDRGRPPVLRHDRALNAIRNYAKNVCKGRCESWKLSHCRRHGPSEFRCHFTGRLPEGETCHAEVAAFLLRAVGGKVTPFGLRAGFNEESCPSGLFAPEGAPWPRP